MEDVNLIPYSNEAEMAVLGCLITNPETITKVVERGIDNSTFYSPRHKDLMRVITDIYSERNNLDVGMIVSYLESHPTKFQIIGGVDYLMNLVNNGSAPSALDNYLDIIEEKHRLRLIIDKSKEFIQQASNVSTGVDEFLFEFENDIVELTRPKGQSTMRHSSLVMDDVLKEFKHAMEHDGTITGLETGYNKLDYYTNGLQAGTLIILAARPAVGKSAFALNIALNVAQLNKEGNASVAIFSLEMPDVQMMQRLTSAVSQVDNYKIQNGKVNQDEFNRINEGATILKNTNLFLEDSSNATMGDIAKQSRKLKEEGKLDLIIIDYLQLINSSSNKNENRQQEVSKISRQLKQLARELEVPVIALSQLSRNVEHREDKRPMLSDLRESGSLEQDKQSVLYKLGEFRETPNT